MIKIEAKLAKEVTSGISEKRAFNLSLRALGQAMRPFVYVPGSTVLIDCLVEFHTYKRPVSRCQKLVT